MSEITPAELKELRRRCADVESLVEPDWGNTLRELGQAVPRLLDEIGRLQKVLKVAERQLAKFRQM